MPYGTYDTRFIDFPPNVDAAYIQGLRNRAGVDFVQVLRAIDQRLGALNTTLDPFVASLITPTTEQFADSTGASAFEVTKRGEYTLARPQVAEGAAHMLPLYGYDVSTEFTEDGLMRMSMSRIMNTVESIFLGLRVLYRKEVLRRLFSDAEVRVAVGTAVTSPGFAGSGTGDNVFSRTTYANGTPIAAGYTQYYRVAAAGLAAGLRAARDRLALWNMGPFDLVASQAMIDLIVAILPGDPANGFVSAGSALVRAGTGIAEAQVDATMYLGVLFGNVRVHMALQDFASDNIAIYKSFGPLNAMNPLAWRYDSLSGRDAVLRYRSLFPLDQAVVKQDLGIGVNNRTAAALISVAAAGAYTPPVIA